MVYVVSHAQQAVGSSAPVNLPRVVRVVRHHLRAHPGLCGVSLEAARVWLSSLAGLSALADSPLARRGCRLASRAPATRSGGAAGWAGGGTARRGASPHSSLGLAASLAGRHRPPHFAVARVALGARASRPAPATSRARAT